jgi:hypothetical protein
MAVAHVVRKIDLAYRIAISRILVLGNISEIQFSSSSKVMKQMNR